MLDEAIDADLIAIEHELEQLASQPKRHAADSAAAAHGAVCSAGTRPKFAMSRRRPRVVAAVSSSALAKM
nr:hypothetical protein [Cupriavidus taiwanensis]